MYWNLDPDTQHLHSAFPVANEKTSTVLFGVFYKQWIACEKRNNIKINLSLDSNQPFSFSPPSNPSATLLGQREMFLTCVGGLGGS